MLRVLGCWEQSLPVVPVPEPQLCAQPVAPSSCCFPDTEGGKCWKAQNRSCCRVISGSSQPQILCFPPFSSYFMGHDAAEVKFVLQGFALAFQALLFYSPTLHPFCMKSPFWFLEHQTPQKSYKIVLVFRENLLAGVIVGSAYVGVWWEFKFALTH